MVRGLIRSVLVAAVAAATLGHIRAADSPAAHAAAAPVLQRFLSLADPPPTEFRALRHLEAHNDHFDSSAWMDVWTEADRSHGFRFEIVAEGGSAYIRRHVFGPALETERRMWDSGDEERAALTPANYEFEDAGEQSDGLASLIVKPRRRDVLLVDGTIFLRPDDGELMRVEGTLSKPPSFWTRRVDIIRRYERIGGIRMPVALESVATVRIAGRSTMRMTYQYQTVDGLQVGDPQPKITDK